MGELRSWPLLLHSGAYELLRFGQSKASAIASGPLSRELILLLVLKAVTAKFMTQRALNTYFHIQNIYIPTYVYISLSLEYIYIYVFTGSHKPSRAQDQPSRALLVLLEPVEAGYVSWPKVQFQEKGKSHGGTRGQTLTIRYGSMF